MQVEKLAQLLTAFKDGSSDLEETLTSLKHLPFEDMGFAKVDSES